MIFMMRGVIQVVFHSLNSNVTAIVKIQTKQTSVAVFAFCVYVFFSLCHCCCCCCLKWSEHANTDNAHTLTHINGPLCKWYGYHHTYLSHFHALWSVSKRKIKLLPSNWWFSLDTWMHTPVPMAFFLHIFSLECLYLLSFFSLHFLLLWNLSVQKKVFDARMLKMRMKAQHRLSSSEPKIKSYSTRKRIPSNVIQLRIYESHYCNNDSFY